MFYDAYAQAKPTGLGKNLNERLNRKLARQLLAGKPAGSPLKIGDVGFGRGLFAAAVRALHTEGAIEYYAIEPNHALALLAQKTCTAVSEKPLPPFPQEEGWTGFDAVMLSHVIEHLPRYETVLAVLRQVVDALNNDGRIMCFFPDYLDYKEDFFSADYSHEFILTRRRMLLLLEDSGFVPVSQTVFRSCFTFPVSAMIYPAHRLLRFIAGILWKVTGRDIFFKIKITFAKNILIIAKKRGAM